MCNVLIVEDVEHTSVVIRGTLENRINGKNGDYPYLDWIHQWLGLRQGQCNFCYTINAIKPELLAALTGSVFAGKKDIEASAVGINKGHAKPDVVVLDLALTEAETKLIATNGGTDRFCRTPDKTGGALVQLTGFKLIKSFLAHRCAVIVTSYSSNPLVETLCMRQGANAFVLKPYTSEQMATAAEFLKLHEVAEKGSTKTAVSELKEYIVAKNREHGIENYLIRIANEVLKQTLLKQVAPARFV